MTQHQDGKVKSTKNIRPLKLIRTMKTKDLTTARKIEAYIKKQKSKVFIQKVIEQGFDMDLMTK